VTRGSLTRFFELMLAVSTLSTAAHAEGGAGLLIFYVAYPFLAFCLLGWSTLVLLMARPRVEEAAATLGRRPLACFVMGMLCLGWLILALALAKPLGRLGGLLVLFTLLVLGFCILLGLPAILMGLGRRASASLALAPVDVREVALGAVVLFAAGGLPFLGWLLLIGVALWAAGGAVLSLLAGKPSKAVEADS
jgi:hypothetical protein